MVKDKSKLSISTPLMLFSSLNKPLLKACICSGVKGFVSIPIDFANLFKSAQYSSWFFGIKGNNLASPPKEFELFLISLFINSLFSAWVNSFIFFLPKKFSNLK